MNAKKITLLLLIIFPFAYQSDAGRLSVKTLNGKSGHLTTDATITSDDPEAPETGGGVGGDDGLTVYLANFNSDFTELRGATPTVNGDATIDTGTKKYGAGAATFDGTGDYVTYPASTSYDLPSGDWTIEFWIYTPRTQTSAILSCADGTSVNTGWGATMNTSGKLQFDYHDGSAKQFLFNAAVVANSWSHMAIVSDSGTLYGYINGTQDSTTTTWSAATTANSDPLTLGTVAGSIGTWYSNSKIDDLRIRKEAVYTANFTPPASELTE